MVSEICVKTEEARWRAGQRPLTNVFMFIWILHSIFSQTHLDTLCFSHIHSLCVSMLAQRLMVKVLDFKNSWSFIVSLEKQINYLQSVFRRKLSSLSLRSWIVMKKRSFKDAKVCAQKVSQSKKIKMTLNRVILWFTIELLWNSSILSILNCGLSHHVTHCYVKHLDFSIMALTIFGFLESDVTMFS